MKLFFNPTTFSYEGKIWPKNVTYYKSALNNQNYQSYKSYKSYKNYKNYRIMALRPG